MIFTDEMKPLKIYRRQFFLPYNDKDKKHGSLVYLLTPNYVSSQRMMTYPLAINRKYFESYYMERNVSYYINSKASKQALEEYANVLPVNEQNIVNGLDFDSFAAYCISKCSDEEELTGAFGEDVKYYESIEQSIYDNRLEAGMYNVFTHEVNSNAPVLIGGIEVIVIEYTDYKAMYKWIRTEDFEIVDEAADETSGTVYFCKDITPENILRMYQIVGKELTGNVAVKLHSGEAGNKNFLGPELYKPIIDHVNGTVVECNTAYTGSKRLNAADHYKLLAEHKWSEYFDVDIMDEYGEIALPVTDGKILEKNLVGENLKNYDSMLVLSHFKGHAMGGYGGALKNISIGVASSNGKKIIHRVDTNNMVGFDTKVDQHEFLKAMSDAAHSVVDHFEGRMVFINVMKNLSVDCDCDGNAAPPCMKDIGILASTNPVALDAACLSLIKNSDDPGKKEMLERINSREGSKIIDYSDWANWQFNLVDIDAPIMYSVKEASSVTFPTGPISNDISWYPIDKNLVDKYKKDIKGLSHVRIAPDCTGYLFVDNKTKKPIGFISVEDKSGDKWIQALEVLPDFRKKGYGKYLLQFAQNQGANFLSVNKSNDIALHMYEKQGWKISGGTDAMHFMMHEASSISNNIVKRWNIISDDGANNCCVQVQGYAKPMRGRTSVMVFKDGKLFARYKNNEVNLPGGGWDPGENPEIAGIREIQEEINVNVKNMRFAGTLIEYHEYVHDWVKEHVPSKDWWYGYYTMIYIADYDSVYRGHVDDIDKDDIKKEGKWYRPEEIYDKMCPEYQHAVDVYLNNLTESTLNEDGPSAQPPEVDIPTPQIPDVGKQLKNFVRTLKMRGKKGMYQMNDQIRELQRGLPTADDIMASLQSGNKANHGKDATEEATFLPNSDESNFIMENSVILLDEADSKYDPLMKKVLYAERMRTSKDQLELLKKIKADNKFIKYAYPNKFDRYQNRNLFYDLSYYIEIYFRNAGIYKMRKGVNLLEDFMERLFDPKRIPASYNKKTIFIPVLDWSITPNTRTWLFRESINPISAIYDLILTNSADRLKRIFGKMDVIFFGNNCYFKINFNDLNAQQWKILKTRFKTFVAKMLSNSPFTADEEDDQPDVESTKVIATNIIDKLETNRGIKMSTQSELIDKLAKQKTKDVAKAATGTAAHSNEKDMIKASDTKKEAVKKVAVEKVEKNTSKATSKEAKEEKIKDTETIEQKKADVVDLVVNVASTSKNTDAAIDTLDYYDDEDFKRTILDLEVEDGEEVKISAARAARMNELNKKFEEKEVKGVKIKDLINEEKRAKEVNAPLPETTVPVDSPFQDQWSDLKYMNFDSTYDVNKDIMKMLVALSEKQYPIAIRDIKIEDTSTSEDFVDTYTVSIEDMNGKRSTFRLDVPKFKDNKYLILRGNKKTIQNQYFNMPILKTEVDTVQVISNYSKIFIRRFGNTTGKTISYCDRLLKALKKYSGNDIKLTIGDNSKLSGSFQAPIDYIDIGSVYSKIEYNGYTFYFNQDEYKKLYKDKMKNNDMFYFGVDTKGELIGISMNDSTTTVAGAVADVLCTNKKFEELWNGVSVAKKHIYSKASIMNSHIPLVIVCALSEGLTTVLNKAHIDYELKEKLSTEDRRNIYKDWIKFSDGYLVYTDTYSSSLLLNGLKEINPEEYSINNIDSKRMWIETLDDFGGRIKADGLENFYECMIDPITYEVLQHYNLPTDYVTLLLYGNNLLADNKYISHGDSSSRRLRRNEVIAVKVYKTLFNDAYAQYANQMRHSGGNAEFIVKQNGVIDKFMTDPTSSDLSIINGLNDIESANAVSTKGESGMNSERAYTLDKRTYDDSMLNVLGLSTGFANNVGVTRQTTMDANVDTERGYVKSINGDLSQMGAAKSLTATEALNPMGSTRDDPQRTGMTFIQTAKHQVRTEKSDPLLVTNGADEVLPYMVSDIFCKKAKEDGKIVELVAGKYMIIEYKDKTHDYVNLDKTIEKNSDGGFYVNTQLTTDLKEGQTIKKNQILAYEERSFSKGKAGESNKLAYNVGKLIKIAVLNSDDNFEDSAMVTSKLAEDLATDIIMKEERILSKDTNIYNIIKPGTKVNQEDILFETQTAYDDEDINILLKNLAGDEEQISKLGRRPVKSPTAGVVEGFRLYRTCEIEDMSESLQKFFKEYESQEKKTEALLKKYGIEDPTLYGSTRKLKPTGKLKNSPDSVLIEVYIKYHDIVAVGDKIVYWSANKGVVHTIVDSEEAPYTDFRPEEEISAFTGISSINKRQIASNVIIGSLNKLCIELGRQVRDILGLPFYDNEIDI